MDITVKRIPDELYQNFRKLSSQNGRSLNSEIIAAMDAAVAEADRRQKLSLAIRDMKSAIRKLPPTPDSTPILRRIRNR